MMHPRSRRNRHGLRQWCRLPNLTITGISRKISVPGSGATSGCLHPPHHLLRSILQELGLECSASRTGTSLFAAKTRPWSDDGSVPFDLRVIADGTEPILQKVRPNSASVNKKPNPTLRENT